MDGSSSTTSTTGLAPPGAMVRECRPSGLPVPDSRRAPFNLQTWVSTRAAGGCSWAGGSRSKPKSYRRRRCVSGGWPGFASSEPSTHLRRLSLCRLSGGVEACERRLATQKLDRLEEARRHLRPRDRDANRLEALSRLQPQPLEHRPKRRLDRLGGERLELGERVPRSNDDRAVAVDVRLDVVEEEAG